MVVAYLNETITKFGEVSLSHDSEYQKWLSYEMLRRVSDVSELFIASIIREISKRGKPSSLLVAATSFTRKLASQFVSLLLGYLNIWTPI